MCKKRFIQSGGQGRQYLRVLACAVLCLFAVGCASRGPLVVPAPADEVLALRVEPGLVTMAKGTPLAVLAVVDGVEQGGAGLPLVWEVADRSLGTIMTSSGLTAVYRRTDISGENRVTVRDQKGNLGRTMIWQEGPDGQVKRQPLPVVSPDTGVASERGSAPESAVPGQDSEGGATGVRAGYTLLLGDEVSLEVFREPDLSGKYRVEQGGVIRHALFGPIEVAGLTVSQAEDTVKKFLNERYLVNPRVTLRVVSSQSSQVLVMGEVKTPGARQIPFDEPTTLLGVIAAAGGFTDLASVNRVKVIRRVDGRQRQIRVKVSRIVSGKDPDIEIHPNDVIMVPQTFF